MASIHNNYPFFFFFAYQELTVGSTGSLGTVLLPGECHIDKLWDSLFTLQDQGNKDGWGRSDKAMITSSIVRIGNGDYILGCSWIITNFTDYANG